MIVIEIIFWLAITGVVWTYFLYPLSLCLMWPRKPHRIDEATPRVTLIISAYNEIEVIEERLENALQMNYPQDQLEIMVISDASDDGTDEAVARFADRGVILRRQSERKGKSAALSEFVPHCSGDIIVFSDANSMYDAEAIRLLVRNFADSRVGYVVGHQRYIEEDSTTNKSESLYWRYETWVKRLESRFGSVVGGDGAIFAIRREYFEPLRADDINDFLIPLRIIVRGQLGVFEPKAFCIERTARDLAGEFRRKVRIVNRSMRAVLRARATLNPFKVGMFAYQITAHKVIRWFAPFLMLVALIANLVLAFQGGWVYPTILGLQIAFYALAVAGIVPVLQKLKPIYIANYFCVVNAAAGLGILTLLLGRKFSTWSPQRVGETRRPVTAD